jgi:hypothetical protein
VTYFRRIASQGESLFAAPRVFIVLLIFVTSARAFPQGAPIRADGTMGETHDFVFEPTKPGQLRMEIRVSVPRPRLMVRMPIRVE